MRKLPLATAAEVLFDEFSAKAPELLGDYISRGEYKRFFTNTYTDVYREGAAWVLATVEPLGHAAEIHAYSFDKTFRDKTTFFREVIADLEALGNIRLWTTLMPQTGHRVHKELLELGFVREGILRSFYYLGPDKGFADGELWARISLMEAHDGV